MYNDFLNYNITFFGWKKFQKRAIAILNKTDNYLEFQVITQNICLKLFLPTLKGRGGSQLDYIFFVCMLRDYSTNYVFCCCVFDFDFFFV